jgi:outer membrane beta-barrel protein
MKRRDFRLLAMAVFGVGALVSSGLARGQAADPAGTTPGAAGADAAETPEPPSGAGTEAAGAPAADDPGAGEAPAVGDAAGRRPSWQDIVVVPRKAFLKSGRLELSPFTGLSLNDVLIRHYAVGGDLNYYFTDVFSVGLQAQYFIKERTEREGLVGLQYNRVPTLNRYKYAGSLNFAYVPGYGKFTLFNRYIWHWDIFASAGIGAIRTEIIPRILGDETFQNTRIAPNFGAGTRLFLNDWLTASVSIRDYVFNDLLEPTNRTPTQTIDAVKSNAISQWVNNVMLYAAVGVYLPTSFQYRSPR